MDSDNVEMSLDNMFPEPERPPTPEPTTSIFVRERTDISEDAWRSISIRLVGSHPLWAHHLWNAARALASFLDDHVELYIGKHVLELGAGGGLPSLVAALNGAKKVVVTDYPDAPLLETIKHNIKENLGNGRDDIVAEGYIWGRDVSPLLSTDQGFDLLILSDLIFNHSQHDAMLKSCRDGMSTGGTVLVFYTHHRPHLSCRDMQFFEKAKEQGWTCVEILTRHFDPMFPEDSGDTQVRSTVHGWTLTRAGPRLLE